MLQEVPKRKSGKVSNLEKFKEELKAMQEQRDERKKLRSHIKECEEKGLTPTLLTSSGKPSRFEASRDMLQNLESSFEKGEPLDSVCHCAIRTRSS